MKILQHKLLYLLAGLVFTLSSCEDVVDINTDDAPSLLVVDAWLNNLQETQTVRLTQSTPYFESNRTPGVEGAEVRIVTNEGAILDFEDVGGGDYEWTPEEGKNIGDIGTEYELTIVWDEKSFSANSRLNPAPTVDSITQELREDELGPDGIYTEFFARDFEGLGDTYWIKTFKNGQFLNKPGELNIAYDAAFDAGAQIDGLIFIPPIREFTNPVPDDVDDLPSPWAVGDVIRVEIHSISQDAFSFMEVARDQMTNSQNTIFALPLANTSGNIENLSTDEEALGVFVVSAITSLERVIE